MWASTASGASGATSCARRSTTRTSSSWPSTTSRTPPTLAHLLKYDSILGNLDDEVKAEGDTIHVAGRTIKVLAVKNPAQLPWKDLGVDYVDRVHRPLHRRRQGQGPHRRPGAKKVIISAPAKGEDITIVMGVNDDKYDPKKHNIVSNASCTTNCLGPGGQGAATTPSAS